MSEPLAPNNGEQENIEQSSNDLASVEKVPASVPPFVRHAAIIETLVFLTAVTGFNIIFGDGARYIQMALHPFWIIVLLVSVQYGPVEALTAAALSAAFLLVGNLPEQSLSETMYDYILRVSLSPLLWVITALVLGCIRMRQINERKGLFERLKKSEESSMTIFESYQSVKQSKERLELRIAEERRSILTVYEVAKSLETLDPLEARDGINQLIRVALNPVKFSLYHWKKNKLTLDRSYGWAAENEFQKSFGGKVPFTQQVIQKGRILSIVRKEDEVVLDGQGMLAGAIIDEQTGKIFGMLKIEEIGFTDMNIRTQETFRIVCAWIARVCVNIEAYQDALEETREEPVETSSRDVA